MQKMAGDGSKNIRLRFFSLPFSRKFKKFQSTLSTVLKFIIFELSANKCFLYTFFLTFPWMCLFFPSKGNLENYASIVDFNEELAKIW